MTPRMRGKKAGGVWAGTAWFLIVALSLYSADASLSLLMCCAYAVPIRSAWIKKPRRFWRFYAAASILAGICLAAWITSSGESFRHSLFPLTMVLPWTACVGIGLLPFSFTVSLTTILSKRAKAKGD